MFWKVAGFSQPSPIEQLLDSEESLTLEQLLDEDDLIQECKSLNGRLIAFLRQRATVEKLLRYLVEPSQDYEDPKRQYKYPFTACEVFCCEVEALFNTLLEDEELMALLFSLLDLDTPLDCKTAGYFGRVIGHLLIRKTNEMMAYLQSNQSMLEKLIRHVDTTSVADIIKRLVGADEQASMLFVPSHTQWLSETPLVDMLLQRLGSDHGGDVQANTADILCAIAHMQPSALSARLMHEDCIDVLFQHALMPGGKVLVPALDVCIALLEPRRSPNDPVADGPSPTAAAVQRFKLQAVHSIVKYVPQLVGLLRREEDIAPQETPYGLLAPPLGSSRLKACELLAVLVRTAEESAEQAVVQADAFSLCMQIFQRYPFNNLLHHNVASMLLAALVHMSDTALQHVFQHCKLLDWLIGLPAEVRPAPRPGDEAAAEARAPLRAGYMGYVTMLANRLIEMFEGQEGVKEQMQAHEGWVQWVEQTLGPRNELEDVQRWQCGRPTAADLGGMDSDGDEYQMMMLQAQGMQPALYHRYGVMDDNDDEDEDETRDEFASMALETSLVTEAMSGMVITDGDAAVDERLAGAADAGATGTSGPGAVSHALDLPMDLTKSMDNDEVLLESSEEEEEAAMEQDAAAAPESAEEVLPPAAVDVEPSSAAGALEDAVAGSEQPMDTGTAADGASMEAAAGNASSSEAAGVQQNQQQEEAGSSQEEGSSTEFTDFQYWKKQPLQFEVPEDA